MSKKGIIFWFRNDLRLYDNEAFFKATEKAKAENTWLLPVYCFDERKFAETSLGFPKTGTFRAKFLIESVQNLKQNLSLRNSKLFVSIGKPEQLIQKLIRQFPTSKVYASKEITEEELSVEQSLENILWQEGISLELFWTSTLYHLDDLTYPIQNLPDIFTQFRKGVEKKVKIRDTFPIPENIPTPPPANFEKVPQLSDLGLEDIRIDTRTVLQFKGGEQAAKERLQSYFWEKQLLHSYKDTRNGLLGSDYSSKFSPWLANGCISPRYIYEEVKKYEQQVHKNQSTYWLVFELIWRDYFRFVAKKYGSRIFQKGGIKGIQDRKYSRSRKLLEAWVNGMTGIPFIDANMRELKYTGFMSNRGRQNVASFLVKDLNLNWQYGAMYFESQLIDYDVCSNWGNWNYVAGVGNDPRENRYFNILSQASRYDAKGEYVKHWLPELALLPSHLVHTAGSLYRKELEEFGITLEQDYPKSVVHLPQRTK